MTDPSVFDIILQCFVFLMFIVFVVAECSLIAKRIAAWWARRNERLHPLSVHMTMNQMNVSEDAAYRMARHARDESGEHNART